MPAIRTDITLWRGTPITIECGVLKADEITPENVSGWTAVFTMRLKATDADPAPVSLAMTVYGLSTNGKLRGTLSKAQTLLLTAGSYDYTVERSNAGSEDVLAYGTATVLLDVVNAA